MIFYIVLCGQVVGRTVEYSTDFELFTFKPNAIKAGFEVRGSDDFNIGVIEDGKLVRIDWMNEVVDADPTYMAEVSEQIGLEAQP